PQIEPAQLLEAANQERQLGLEGGATLALVKRLQKRIVFRLDDALCRQALSENPRQRALPNSYGTFDRNVTGKLEKLGHGLSIVVENWKAEYIASRRDAMWEKRSLVVRGSLFAAQNSCERRTANSERRAIHDQLESPHASYSDRIGDRCCRRGGISVHG